MVAGLPSSAEALQVFLQARHAAAIGKVHSRVEVAWDVYLRLSHRECCLQPVDQPAHKETMKILKKIGFVPIFPQLMSDRRHALRIASTGRRTDLNKDHVKKLVKSSQALCTQVTVAGCGVFKKLERSSRLEIERGQCFPQRRRLFSTAAAICRRNLKLKTQVNRFAAIAHPGSVSIAQKAKHIHRRAARS